MTKLCLKNEKFETTLWLCFECARIFDVFEDENCTKKWEIVDYVISGSGREEKILTEK